MTCTHTPMPYAYCAPRVGGFRTREDERARTEWGPCLYGRGPYASILLAEFWIMDPAHQHCLRYVQSLDVVAVCAPATMRIHDALICSDGFDTCRT